MQSNTRPRRLKPLPLRGITTLNRDEAIGNFLALLDTPKALAVWLLYKASCRGDKAATLQLLELPCKPEHYTQSHPFALDYQAVRLFSKYKGLNSGIDRVQAALDAASRAERHCAQSNEIFRAYRSGNVSFLALSETILSSIQGLIADTLDVVGSIPVEDMGWSSGRTTSAYGDTLDPISKYGSRMDVTVSARRWALAFLRDCPNWVAGSLQADGPCSALSSALNIVDGNVMLTVPKNAKTDRVICYEPHLNIRMQLAVGNVIRRALRKKGVNLGDQSINRRRALLGSKTGHLATIDLRSASDTVSLELVYTLLPINWVLMLDDLRSKRTLWPDGVTRPNEKFSSMGNGFTFELESLIFWAACTAVCKTGVSVYGDDIVIPTEHFDECVGVLNALGFEINGTKSFASGLFRESCGCDAFLGVDTTPIRLTDELKTVSRWVLFHNQIRRWASAHLPMLTVAECLGAMRSLYPFPMGPAVFTDRRTQKEKGQGHYHVNWDEGSPFRSRRSETWCGWNYYQWSLVAKPKTESYSFVEGFSALCASTGPKRLEDSYSSNAYRAVSWVKTCSWTSEWSSVLWSE